MAEKLDRSFLINTAFITNISSDNTGVTLNGNAEITIARERKQDFIQFLKHVTLK